MQMRTAMMALISTSLAMVAPADAQDVPPTWAFPSNPAFEPKPDDGQLRHVPGSGLAFTTAQTRDHFFAPDWHPGDHRRMPAVVATGRKPDVFACGYCHRADGPGGPENASLAGLSAAYITEQITKFRDGSRRSSVPDRAPVQSMIKIAKAMSEADIHDAAAYFSSLGQRQAIKVVETTTVPVTEIAGPVLIDARSGRYEPLGERIIEVPEDAAQFENRDAHSRFIAYAPIDSVRKGDTLAASTDNKLALSCPACHGPDLQGVGNVPPLAGRSPSYLVRQLYDFKHGARTGGAADVMNQVASAMTIGDMINLAAYVASLPPRKTAPALFP